MARRAAVLLVAALLAGCDDRPGFDAAAWARERGNYDGASRRGALVAALPGAGLRPGIARERVRALLGPPDAGGADEEVYYLGRSAIGPHFETYRVAYDGEGRVVRLSVRRD